MRPRFYCAVMLFASVAMAEATPVDLFIGADGPVNAIYQRGSNIYVGGRFTKIGTVAANNVARWDGLAWTALGAGTDGEIHALEWVSGLIVGGRFSTAGGIATTNIARWDGTSWSALGAGLNGPVLAMATIAGSLYVGGEFSEAGGARHQNIAIFSDSEGWRSAGGVNGAVQAMAVLDGREVYVGGRFTQAGGVRANHLAILEWGTGTWQTFTRGSSAGTGGPVLALALQPATPARDLKLFVGGRFDAVNVVEVGSINEDPRATPVAANNIAVFNLFTDQWSALAETNDIVHFVAGGGVNTEAPGAAAPFVKAVLVEGETIYVGGNFRTADGRLANNIAQWDGRSWLSSAGLFGGGIEGTVHALGGNANGLWVGGDFDQADFLPASNLALWRAGAGRADWTAPGLAQSIEPPPTNASPFRAMTSFASSVNVIAASRNHLYAFGPWASDDGIANQGIWRWNSRVWHRIGQPKHRGFNGSVTTMAFAGGDLIIGGLFDEIDGLAVTNVAIRNGSSWNALGAGLALRAGQTFTLGGAVRDLAADGSTIYAAGEFITSEAGTNVVYLGGIARYRRGQAWEPLGQGLLLNLFGNTAVGIGHKLLIYRGQLYVGGQFDWGLNADGTRVPAKFFARWDGTQWHAIQGITAQGPIQAMATDGRNLYVAGPLLVGNSFTPAGVAHWDGVDWRALGNARYASALAIYGQHLYMSSVSEISFERMTSPLWRFDGLNWAPVGAPDSWRRVIDGQPRQVEARDLLIRDDELFVAGDFTQAGGIPSRGVVRFNLLPQTITEWRNVHFTPVQRIDPLASADEADPDRDGMTNRQEFEAGTDPQDPESRFDMEPMEVRRGLTQNAEATITFVALAHRTYTVQYREETDAGWRKLVDIPARDLTRIERVVDRAVTAVFRMYRLVAPAI